MPKSREDQPAGEFDPGLRRGEYLTNERLQRVFGCGSLGGMRRSLRTNSLVLISTGNDPAYYNRWHGTVFHCTGMGLKGDQDLDYAQNRTLADSDTNGVAVFHFDNREPNQYIFTGRVRLASAPYQEAQPDKQGNERKVWVFPLEVVPPAVDGARGRGAAAGRKRRPWWKRLFGRRR